MTVDKTIQELADINESFNRIIKLKSVLDELMNRRNIWERSKTNCLAECREAMEKLEGAPDDEQDIAGEIELMFYRKIFQVLRDD